MVILNKYGGWSVKDLQRILELQHETKVSQSMEPWLEKAAKLWRSSPERTLAMLMYAATDRVSPSSNGSPQRQ